MPRLSLRVVLVGLLGLVLWEALGRFTPWGMSCVPAPSLILADLIDQGDLYRVHALATARVAMIGFLVGNAVAAAAAILFCLVPTAERIFRGVNVTLFALPVIVLGPLLVLVCDDDLPQIITSAVTVYFPSMAAMLVGLREIDPRLADLVRVYGGQGGAELRFIRLRNALPSAFGGLGVASSLAVLGAILGEFGSGGRWGLGSFLLGSLGQANPARLWGIGLVGTALALTGYALFALAGRRYARTTAAVTTAATLAPTGDGRPRSPTERVILLTAAIVLPFLLWHLAVKGPGLSPIIAPGPVETIGYLASSAEARATLLAALGQTLPVAALGLVCGLAAAFGLAALAALRPTLVRAAMPAVLILQSTPLVVLAPIMLLVFGRSVAASVAMTVLVVFFPAFVLVADSFRLVPGTMKDVVAAYGGSRWQELRFVSARHASAYLLAAARLVAPKALLGTMISEWLLTGTGLGNLLNTARGQMDYTLVWGGAMISVLVALAAYLAVAALERLVRPGRTRQGPQGRFSPSTPGRTGL